MLQTKTILSRTIAAVYLVAICFICFANIGDAVDGSATIAGIPFDKAAHFLMFLPFAVLAYLSFEHEKKGVWANIGFVLLTILAGFFIAGTTEVIQSKLPYRGMEIADLYADCLGISLGSIYVLVVALCNERKIHRMGHGRK